MSRGALLGILSIGTQKPWLCEAGKGWCGNLRAAPRLEAIGGFLEIKTPKNGYVYGTALAEVLFFFQFCPLLQGLTPVSWAVVMEGRTSSRAIEVMSEDHLQKVLQWAGELGWNPGQNDATPFRTADRDGYFSISQDDGGVMAGESRRSSGAPASRGYYCRSFLTTRSWLV